MDNTMDSLLLRNIWFLFVLTGLLMLSGCGGGSSSGQNDSVEAWSKVTAAIDDAQSGFPNGLAVEIATPDGVVYSRSRGGFTNSTRALVASASKWVTATVLLRLVDQGVLSLDEKMSGVLEDRYGVPWSGPDRKSTRLNSSHRLTSRMPSSA
jgi:CubicO group peptidase (beta-lactamase class C family)